MGALRLMRRRCAASDWLPDVAASMRPDRVDGGALE